MEWDMDKKDRKKEREEHGSREVEGRGNKECRKEKEKKEKGRRN